MRPERGRALVAVALAAAGCRRGEPIPTDKALVARAASAPALSALQPDATASIPVYRGEVLLPRNRFSSFAWRGTWEGQPASRTGAIEAARSPADTSMFVFGSDLLEAEVPTASWLCSRMGNPVVGGSPCAQSLRRTVVGGGKLIAHIPCKDPACPIAELSEGVVTPAVAPALTALRVVTLGKRQAVLAWSQWSRAPEWNGRRVLVYLLAPPLQRVGEIAIEELDAREDKVVTRSGMLEVLEDGLGFNGRRVVTDRATGAEVSAQPIRERFMLTEEGKLVWKR